MNVVDHKEARRYELTDGDIAVGFVEYHFYRDEIALLHTEIKPEFEGHGYGSTLIKAVLDDARARALKVLPYCPFVRAYMEKHPEYQDLVPATHKPMFDFFESTVD